MTRTKISQKEAIKSTTMFLINNQIESKYEDLITSELEAYKSMLGVSTKEGLSTFIKSERTSVKRLITVMGITGEKFKRVVTMIRVLKGYTFDSEWDEERVQSELSSKPELMSEFCDLLLNGKDLPKYQKLIPKYILDDFKLDTTIIARICNEDILRKLIKSSYASAYNKDYSKYYSSLIDNKIKSIVGKYGLAYETKPLNGISKNELHLIGDTEKYIIVNYLFNLTTSKAQTDYAEGTIGGLKSSCRGNKNILIVNVLDGAGWVARSADYKKIYNDCDLFLTLKTLDSLESTIKEFFNIN